MNGLRVLAQRIRRVNGSEYLFAIPIGLILDLLEIPDPLRPFPDNRRVNKKHALDFGNYWEAQDLEWVIPPLLLDYPRKLSVHRLQIETQLSNLVEIEIPADHTGSLKILDGQHRILGWYLKRLELVSRNEDHVSVYNKYVISGKDRELAEVEEKIARTKYQLDRFQTEHVSINLIDNLDARRHQQFFVDIAKNAMGINKTVQAKFDNSSIVNRVTQEIIQNHTLLKNRIDMEKTTCSGSNPNLLTVVNVADIVRHSCFGIAARVTSKREAIFADESLRETVVSFLDCMQTSIPQLNELIAGRTEATQFRAEYLIGSSTIWRCLAGAYHESCVVIDDDEGYLGIDKAQEKSFSKMLRQLSQNMSLPISENWLLTGLFPKETSKAPSSRTQDLLAMAMLFSAWTANDELFNPPTPEELE